MSVTRRWIVLAALAAVVVLAAGWLLLVKPQNSKVSSLHTQTDQQNQSNSLLLTQIAALQSEQKQLPQQQLALQKFSTEVPDSAAEPTLIRQLTTAAHQAGVNLVSITPGAPAAVAASSPTGSSTLGSTSASSAAAASSLTLYQMPVSLAIIGSYANVEAFFNAVEHLPRAMLVSDFSLCPEHTSGLGAGCSTVGEPSNKVALPNDLGATISTTVFYTPVATTTSTTSTQTLTAPTTTTPETPAPGTTGAPKVTGPSTTGAVAGQTS